MGFFDWGRTRIAGDGQVLNFLAALSGRSLQSHLIVIYFDNPHILSRLRSTLISPAIPVPEIRNGTRSVRPEDA